jgi:hypothetical protein
MCHSYHAAYGLLFDKLTDVLALAKTDNNEEAAFSAIAQDMFGQIAAMAQHCAEELGLCTLEQKTEDGTDLVKENAIRYLDAILSNAIKNQMVVPNPHQKDSSLVVFQMDTTLLYDADQFLGALMDD